MAGGHTNGMVAGTASSSLWVVGWVAVLFVVVVELLFLEESVGVEFGGLVGTGWVG